jgi:hypothetical protein
VHFTEVPEPLCTYGLPSFCFVSPCLSCLVSFLLVSSRLVSARCVSVRFVFRLFRFVAFRFASVGPFQFVSTRVGWVLLRLGSSRLTFSFAFVVSVPCSSAPFGSVLFFASFCCARVAWARSDRQCSFRASPGFVSFWVSCRFVSCRFGSFRFSAFRVVTLCFAWFHSISLHVVSIRFGSVRCLSFRFACLSCLVSVLLVSSRLVSARFYFDSFCVGSLCFGSFQFGWVLSFVVSVCFASLRFVSLRCVSHGFIPFLRISFQSVSVRFGLFRFVLPVSGVSCPFFLFRLVLFRASVRFSSVGFCFVWVRLVFAFSFAFVVLLPCGSKPFGLVFLSLLSVVLVLRGIGLTSNVVSGQNA